MKKKKKLPMKKVTAAKKPSVKAKSAKKTVVARKTPAKAVKALKVVAAKRVKPIRSSKGTKGAVIVEETKPKKLKLTNDVAGRYKHLLLDLRDHLIDGVNFLASDNLKRTTRETTGELSGYSLHMADAGTDNFDREFALSLVSNEQEALYEIEEALKRLEQGTYGLCGMCEKPVRKERLEAVPFARLCVQCQSEVEKDKRHPAQVTTVFSDSDDEGGDGEEAEE